MTATLNQDDIKLLKSVFATKDDLKRFATKDDLKRFATKDDLKRFATKDDLTGLEERFEKRFDDLDTALIKYSKDIESRIEKLEDAVGISVAN